MSAGPAAVRPIRKLLVANRGEIARRIVRAASSMGIATVALWSDPDAGAPHVQEADESVRLPGSTAAETYLQVDAIVAAAIRTGADAVHPGYGFLSENPALAAAVAATGLAFVGPPASAIAQMGSKIAAKALVEAAGVPVLPGRTISDEEPADPETLAAELGLPLLVKASAGGGGRGMRIVTAAKDLAAALEGAQAEAASAFGDPTVFLERYLELAHHVEIQVLADCFGTTVHLGERDCSVQRRHQKIVEEAPSPVVDPALREAMGAAAVAAARAVGYVGAGTVEFLVDGSGSFWFLEMNTRLQVEHPVTELVTDLDLVRQQLLVAEGRPLGEDVLAAAAAGARGHAVEARLYAEDPAREYLPSTGTITRFHVPGGDGLRVDAGVVDGSVVSAYYDPLLAKVIAWAPTREEAARRLARALAGAHVHGVRTNRDLLVAILTDEEFLAGAADVQFLERRSPVSLVAGGARPEAVRLHTAAAALAEQAGRRGAAGVLAAVPSGWRSNPSQPQVVHYDLDGREVAVEYRFARGGVWLSIDGEVLADLRLHGATPSTVDLEIGGVRRRVEVDIAGDLVHVDSALGAATLRRLPRFPDAAAGAGAGSLVAPMPGVVARVPVAVGDEVEAGQPVVVVESMKMEHPVRAPGAGRVAEVRVEAGDQVDAGAVLIVMDTP